MKDFTEKPISSNLVFDGKVIKVYKETVLLPNGKKGYREIVRHRGAVAAVPVQDGKIYLVRQFRYAAQTHLLEVPAGKLDSDDEDPEWRTREELMEEIGKDAKTLIPLGYIYTSPGFATEKIYLYLATDLVDKKKEADEDEFLEIVEMDFEEAVKMCVEGEIPDSKTNVAIMRAWHKLKGGI